MSEEEYRQHEAEEVEGHCPECGREPLTITIPSVGRAARLAPERLRALSERC
jgi:hypothetical protein